MRWPAPTVEPHPIPDTELPATARRAKNLAQANGWTVHASSATGTVPDKDWRTGRTVERIMLRASRPRSPTVVMLWWDGRFNTAVTSDAYRLGYRGALARLGAR